MHSSSTRRTTTSSSNRRASDIAAGLGIPGLIIQSSDDIDGSATLGRRNAYPRVNTPSVHGDERGDSSERDDRELDSPRLAFIRRMNSTRNSNDLSDGHRDSYQMRDHASPSPRLGLANESYQDEDDDDRFLESVRKEHAQGLPLLSSSASRSPYTTPKLGASTSGQFGSPYMNGGSSSPRPLGDISSSNMHRKKTSASVLEMMAPGSPRLGGTMGRSGQSSWVEYMTGRRRLPAWSLLPAFLFGVFLAMSSSIGAEGATKIKDSITSLASSSSTSSLSSALSHLSRPEFVSHPSGLLYMDQVRTSLGALEQHPIHTLIANATAKWDALLAKQSKTLAEAAQEYRARYNRHPPKGFDAWYKFAQERNVILIDEYDQIHRDFLPFRSLSPALLHSRIQELEDNPFTHTFVVRNGRIEITGAKKELGRASDQAGLMKNFVKLLPDVNITMSAHDGPSVLVDHGLKDRHIQAGLRNKKLTDKEANVVDDDPANWGWNLACPRESRLRQGANGLETGALPDGPSFVQDHLRTMDMCANPEWQYLHGFTSWAGPRPRTLTPLFSFAKTTMHSDILCVPLEQFVNTPDRDPEWEEKKFAKIIWRGGMTGVWYDRITFWRSSQRSRLHFLSQAKEGSRYVRFIQPDAKNASRDTIVEKEVDLPTLNQRYLDAGYVGKLHQCTPDDGGCEAIPAQPEMQTLKGMDWESQNDYKYIVDTDGNAWSGRFHRLMASNSLVLKSTIFPEWYSDRIMPWVHYVPLKIDYTDIYDLMAFFSGDLDGKHGHDELAKKIAYQGKEWTQKHWRWEDMETYAFRLYLEWARISNWDQTDVDYTGP